MGVDYSLLGFPKKVGGVGSRAKIYKVPAILSFQDESEVQRDHAILLGIIEADPKGDNKGMPSLLGRDIINEYRMVFDFYASRLHFDLV